MNVSPRRAWPRPASELPSPVVPPPSLASSPNFAWPRQHRCYPFIFMSSWKQLFQKGVAMFRAGQLDDALALFTEVGHHGRLIYAGAYSAHQALSLEANEYTLYDSRAAVKEKLGKTKDALRDCKKVIDLAPQRWQVRGCPSVYARRTDTLTGICSLCTPVPEDQEV